MTPSLRTTYRESPGSDAPHFRVMPADDRYPGMTEITLEGRSFSCVGVGSAVERELHLFALGRLASAPQQAEGE